MRFIPRLQAFERCADAGVLLRALAAVRQVYFQAGLLRALFAHQILVYIIPVYLGILQKFLKIRSVLQHIAFHAMLLQERFHRPDTGRCGIDCDFFSSPSKASLSFFSVCRA